MFALLVGLAFGDSLRTFVDLSREALTAPPREPINVNQLLLRPFLLRVAMAALLLLPLVTARACLGHVDDGRAASRAVLARFLAVMRVYLAMLGEIGRAHV